jgi:hypothetical protein
MRNDKKKFSRYGTYEQKKSSIYMIRMNENDSHDKRCNIPYYYRIKEHTYGYGPTRTLYL